MFGEIESALLAVALAPAQENFRHDDFGAQLIDDRIRHTRFVAAGNVARQVGFGLRGISESAVSHRQRLPEPRRLRAKRRPPGAPRRPKPPGPKGDGGPPSSRRGSVPKVPLVKV